MATKARQQYSREELKAIEKVVLEDPKKYISRPAPRPDEPRRGRFERPPGYQGRAGRDRDAETFEEGFQYELDQRKGGDGFFSDAFLPSASALEHQPALQAHLHGGQPPAPKHQPQPQYQQPQAVPQQQVQPVAVAAAAPQPRNDDTFDLSKPLKTATTQPRKSRFNFGDAPAQEVQPQQAQPIFGQQSQQHPVPHQPSSLPTSHHAMPNAQPTFGYAAPVPANPAPQAHGHAMPAYGQPQGGQPMPQPGMFTVVGGQVYQTQAVPVPQQQQQQQQQHQQHALRPAMPAPPQQAANSFTVTSSNDADLNVAATIAKQTGSRQQQPRANRHQSQQQQQQQGAMPVDPAIVSYAANTRGQQQQQQHQQQQQQPPPALQALFSGLGSANVAPGGGKKPNQGSAIDASALEASLAQQAGGASQGRQGQNQQGQNQQGQQQQQQQQGQGQQGQGQQGQGQGGGRRGGGNRDRDRRRRH